MAERIKGIIRPIEPRPPQNEPSSIRYAEKAFSINSIWRSVYDQSGNRALNIKVDGIQKPFEVPDELLPKTNLIFPIVIEVTLYNDFGTRRGQVEIVTKNGKSTAQLLSAETKEKVNNGEIRVYRYEDLLQWFPKKDVQSDTNRGLRFKN